MQHRPANFMGKRPEKITVSEFQEVLSKKGEDEPIEVDSKYIISRYQQNDPMSTNAVRKYFKHLVHDVRGSDSSHSGED